MENLDIIKKAETLLPDTFKSATIISNGKPILLFDYLENGFINYLKSGADPQIVVQCIKTKLIPIITLDDFRVKAVDEFVNSYPLFRDVIQTGPKTFISARKYLIDYCLEHMQKDGTIEYINTSVSLSELYIKLLHNEYHEPTIEDKAELCIDMISYIERMNEEILTSTLDGMNITVRDYLANILPTKMDSIDTVLIGEESISLEEFVTHIVKHQVALLEEEKEKKEKAKEDEYNKTGDNPGLVSEIQVRLKENDSLEITAEIPVVTSSLLTNEERDSLLNNYSKKESVTDEEHYRSIFNKLKQTINETSNSHDLDSKSKYFDIIVTEARSSATFPELEPYIQSVSELIANKQRSLIKINGNSEEYTDVLFSEINSMNDELNGFTTLDEYSTLFGKALERYQDAISKGIKDTQLKGAFKLLFSRINEKRLNLDATIGYQSPEVERVKVGLNELISNIKQDVLTIEHDSNNLGNIAGTEVRLNKNIESAYEKVEEAYNANLLSETDREYYRNALKCYGMAIQSETKIGFGKRWLNDWWI